MRTRIKASFFGLCLAPTMLYAQTPALEVRLETDEADAVLALVELGARATARNWASLFESEGYRRLKQREEVMGRAFTDSSFRVFVQDSALARRAPALRAALAAWKRVDMAGAASRAFRYLPEDARIRATIYPSIKPRTNTFVFEARTNPAIFFYLDPAMTAGQFENTLAHELHHLGVASSCAQDTTRPLVQQWLGGFAEGRAVLAAAGDPDVHPHATSPVEERAVWERDYANVPQDMHRMEMFFTDLMRGALTEQQQNARGFQFIATDSVPQGAFYTVGYHMARAVEKELGREQLIASLCEPIQFLRDYNRVARQRGLSEWSADFIRELMN